MSINIGGESELSRANNQITYKHEAHYENREKQLKTAKVEAVFTIKSFSVEVSVTFEILQLYHTQN